MVLDRDGDPWQALLMLTYMQLMGLFKPISYLTALITWKPLFPWLLRYLSLSLSFIRVMLKLTIIFWTWFEILFILLSVFLASTQRAGDISIDKGGCVQKHEKRFWEVVRCTHELHVPIRGPTIASISGWLFSLLVTQKYLAL